MTRAPTLEDIDREHDAQDRAVDEQTDDERDLNIGKPWRNPDFPVVTL